ncbi:DUF3775 domain-containing protein [Nitratireductor sp. ZSWI3]|uniref:DUF3775 domain-containing protein n=1 Tax=Nitratireductor sp. ZSWI3 TaxID=2966359 RepID=UPI0021500120|nr:DUF3775 domain-containing protein [Nitratireductor sp. ZSWI3]MCR4268250.1 DUF3775 domain-containing protein [Nitratireductor sp. ZSWI3]
MQKSIEREWDLTIDPDTVRMLAEKARAFSAAINEDYDDGKEHEIEFDDAQDQHQHDGLAEEETEDLTEEEFRELVSDLNVDEAAELVAIAWIGRGDYEPGEWADAVNDARQYGNKRVASYLLGMPMLGNWLEGGLDAIGAA